MMLNRLTALMTFSIGIVVANYGACAQQDYDVVYTTTCSPVDGFYDCTINCTLSTMCFDYSWSWNYFTTSEDNNIVIYDGVQLTSQGNTHTLSLALRNYNAGTYQCIFNVGETSCPSYNATIKIGQAENGADINETCQQDHDCNALNATCYSNNYPYGDWVCQCFGQYNISYNTGGQTLACLKLQPEGGHCYSQSECDWPTESYSCIDSHCHCTAVTMKVQTMYTEKCIEPVSLNGECFYKEQCELMTKDSDCDSHRCQCVSCADGYNYHKRKNECCYPMITPWEAFGIAMGGVMVLVILGLSIRFCVRKRKRPSRVSRGHSASSLETIEQFDNVTIS